MDKNIEVNLELLISILDKKLDLMNEIYNIVINQKTMLQSDNDCFSMLKETGNMVKEKTLQINSLDSEFQSKYDTISSELSMHKEDYKGYIILLKEKIKASTELKLKIKLQEEKNKSLLENQK